MDYLREGIHLRGFAQIDPLVEYKNEGFTMFRELMNSIWEEFARYIFHVEVEIEPAQAAAIRRPRLATQLEHTQPQLHRAAGPSSRRALSDARRAGRCRHRRDGRRGRGVRRAARGRDAPRRRASDKVGRNDPCWCGSGKKFKKCHGA